MQDSAPRTFSVAVWIYLFIVIQLNTQDLVRGGTLEVIGSSSFWCIVWGLVVRLGLFVYSALGICGSAVPVSGLVLSGGCSSGPAMRPGAVLRAALAHCVVGVFEGAFLGDFDGCWWCFILLAVSIIMRACLIRFP